MSFEAGKPGEAVSSLEAGKPGEAVSSASLEAGKPGEAVPSRECRCALKIGVCVLDDNRERL